MERLRRDKHRSGVFPINRRLQTYSQYFSGEAHSQGLQVLPFCEKRVVILSQRVIPKHVLIPRSLRNPLDKEIMGALSPTVRDTNVLFTCFLNIVLLAFLGMPPSLCFRELIGVNSLAVCPT